MSASAATLHDRMIAELLSSVDGLIRGMAPDVAVGWLEICAVRRLAVLLSGPTGSGKTRLAKHLMATAGMRGAIKWERVQELNLAAVSPRLAEFQLFGSAGRQFSDDSDQPRPGIIESAHESALFLDEVHLAPRSVQSKLLRVVETRRVRRMGGDQEIPADVWFIAASSAPERMLPELAYRLAGAHFQVTSLADRHDHIVGLARDLLNKWLRELRNLPPEAGQGEAHEAAPIQFDPEVEEELRRNEWPGNVRQLDSLMMRIAMIAGYDPKTITSEHFERAREVALDEGLFVRTRAGRAASARATGEADWRWETDDDFVKWLEKGVQHSPKHALPTEALCRVVLANAYVRRFGSHKAASRYFGVNTPTTVGDAQKKYGEVRRNKYSGMDVRKRPSKDSRSSFKTGGPE